MPGADRDHRPACGAARGEGAGLLRLIIAACAAACAAPPAPVRSVPEPVPAVAPIVVPAGVDSAVAVRADSVAQLSFVSLAEQERAVELQRTGQALVTRTDSLWAAFARSRDSTRSVAPGDSVRAREAALAGGRTLVALDRELRRPEVATSELAARSAVLLDSAQHALEDAFRLDPFDPRTRLWLAQVYELQARRAGQAAAYQRAIDELEKLAALTPDQHGVFAMLANDHYQLGQWRPAARNYREAARVHLATYDLAADAEAAPDSTLLHGYARAEADMWVRLRDAAEARTAYARALGYARMAAESSYVRGELDWIAWDGGRIESSAMRDSLVDVERRGELGGAREGYRRLRSLVTAPRAIDEVDWRLAIVEYAMGDGDTAAVRLRELVGRTARDSTGAAEDSIGARYLADYATLCLNLGRSALRERRDNRTALKYFEQAAQVVWSGQAVAFLEIATLLQGNVALALRSAEQALAREASLTPEQRKSLYRLLMGLHRRAGDFEKARRFRDALLAPRGA
ncbi:MAG: hypothetical protein OEW77_05235 [Gemmatimonadota bacterium]|nr:hypothetical protein [Gemmatimonadota bacterium]